MNCGLNAIDQNIVIVNRSFTFLTIGVVVLSAFISYTNACVYMFVTDEPKPTSGKFWTEDLGK